MLAWKYSCRRAKYSDGFLCDSDAFDRKAEIPKRIAATLSGAYDKKIGQK